MKRIGLLVGLLVLVLGTGVMAQSPSPEATPLYTPDDLASSIPSHVGQYELCVVADAEVDPASIEMWRAILLPLGKDPDDVRRVVTGPCLGGEAPSEASAPTFTVSALRVDGVPARDYIEQVADFTLETLAPTTPTVVQWAWRLIDGRRVYSLTWAPPEVVVQVLTQMAAEEGIELTEGEVADIIRDYADLDPDVGLHLYPSGEVFYGIGIGDSEDRPTLAEVLAELP